MQRFCHELYTSSLLHFLGFWILKFFKSHKHLSQGYPNNYILAFGVGRSTLFIWLHSCSSLFVKSRKLGGYPTWPQNLTQHEAVHVFIYLTGWAFISSIEEITVLDWWICLPQTLLAIRSDAHAGNAKSCRSETVCKERKANVSGLPKQVLLLSKLSQNDRKLADLTGLFISCCGSLNVFPFLPLQPSFLHQGLSLVWDTSSALPCWDPWDHVTS